LRYLYKISTSNHGVGVGNFTLDSHKIRQHDLTSYNLEFKKIKKKSKRIKNDSYYFFSFTFSH